MDRTPALGTISRATEIPATCRPDRGFPTVIATRRERHRPDLGFAQSRLAHSDLDLGTHAVVIAGADRDLAEALALGQHDAAIVDRAAAILLARGDEHVVDPAIEIERAQRPREAVLARPRDALGGTVAGSGLAMQAQPGVLEVGAAAPQ